MESDSSRPTQENRNIKQRLALIASVPLSIGVIALGVGSSKAKDIASGLASYIDSYEPHRLNVKDECQGRQEITVQKGDNQWSLEQKYIKGADRVLSSSIGTVTIESHPGDGILEPGDRLIMPVRCARVSKPQN